MSRERQDDVLESALATGQVPPGLSAPDRAEVEEALAARDLLMAAATEAGEEAEAAMPMGRAAFERFMLASRPPAVVPEVEVGGTAAGGPRWLPAPGAAMPLRYATVAGPALLGLLGLLAFLWLFYPPGGASPALALEAGDYVQIQGVVSADASSSPGSQLEINSDYGRFKVLLLEGTAGAGAGDSSPFRRGDAVVVAGIVGTNQTVGASVIERGQGGQSLPTVAAVRRAAAAKPGLAGSIQAMRVASSGKVGEVVVVADDGERYSLAVDGEEFSELLQRLDGTLGARVTVVGIGRNGLADLEVATGGSGERRQPPGRLLELRGVVVGGSGNVLQVKPGTGAEAQVVLQPSTRIFPGRSGLDASGGLDADDLVGHSLVVTGSPSRQMGQVIAHVVILGQAPAHGR